MLESGDAIAGVKTGANSTSDRADRLRRSLRRLGYDLKDGERRGMFHIVRDGATISEGGDLFGLDLAGVEAWIRKKARGSVMNLAVEPRKRYVLKNSVGHNTRRSRHDRS